MALGDYFKNWTPRLLLRSLHRGRPDRARPVPPCPVEIEIDGIRQWTMIEHFLSACIGRVRAVEGLQRTATQHLDAAEYSLGQISRELGSVMPVPVTAEEASVHMMTPPAETPRAPTRRIAA